MIKDNRNREEVFGPEDDPETEEGLPFENMAKSKTEALKASKSKKIKEQIIKEEVPEVEAPEVGPFDGTGLPDEEEEFFEEDFTNEEEGGPAFVPKGFYHAKVKDMEKTLSQTGNPQYTWKFRIIAGPSGVKNASLRYWTSLLPQSRWKVVETLEALGVKALGSIARFKRGDVIGKPCIIQVEEEPYEGRPTSKIRKIFRPNDKTLVAMEELKDDVPF